MYRLAISTLAMFVLTGCLSAQTGRITVKLVTDFDSARPVSELEEIRPVTTTQFTDGGSRDVILGERCVLWVRNAHLDGRFFFERFYQDKYIGRSAVLDLDAKELGAGKHVLQPGHHVFALGVDGKLASDDPDIRIVGNTLLLRMYRVNVHAVDATKQGPSAFRLVPYDTGVLALDEAFRLDPKKLPDAKKTLDPRKPPAKDKPIPPFVNLLSVQKPFLPLEVWLPANTTGQGYLLFPSWQTFHVKPGGAIELSGGGSPRVPGIDADKETIVIPNYPMSGVIHTRQGLSAGVGPVSLAEKMTFGATLAPVQFLAGLRDPRNEQSLTAFATSVSLLGAPLPVVGTWLATKPTGVSLPIDNDLSRRPHKFFVADNTTSNREAIRLMVLEWDRPVFTRNEEAKVGLRFLDSPLTPTLTKPEVHVSWSPYNPSNPKDRQWKPLQVTGWSEGELRFLTPDVEFQFLVFKVEIRETGDDRGVSLLAGEMYGCLVSPAQEGSASFATNKGRNAFECGEEIEVTLILRSRKVRATGEMRLVLTHPDGARETINKKDTGETWLAQGVRIPAARTLQLAPGRYSLSVHDLASGIVGVPFSFDLAGRQKPSLFHIVKPSKYTGPMNGLEPSHLRGKPIDLDRTMKTLADLGYTRVDHMSYMTNRHLRAYTWREDLAASDDRLPTPESVFIPTPRDQMMNACVRQQLQFSDIWLSYGDFALPRYIEPYIQASERWMAREVQAQRHSPAWDGLILYDEMYQNAAVGFVKEHATWFNKVRARLAEEKLGQSPKNIEESFSRYLQRPKDQRDPKSLRAYLDYTDWQQLGWKDYISRVVDVGRHLEPRARFGTYHRTWMLPGANDDLYNGYPPDLFDKLDIIGHIHYADNSTSWVSIPQMARILRTGKNKTLYVNMPLAHEWRTNLDGQYQRHMAFALLAQGANGVSQWGLPTTFEDGPNTTTMQNRDTTAILNREILQAFGEIVDRTGEGYRKVGIVSTKNSMLLSAHKSVPTPNQTEAIWIACWRLGYPALFVREEHFKEKLDGYSVLFVPGIRFEGELDEAAIRRLREAMASGTRVVVEADSVLDLPGITKLTDWRLDSYHLGDSYFPTWLDDELNKVYEKTQPVVDYLRPRFKEWDIEPAAVGPFTVGPSWRDGGQAQYLIMANFEDPNYRHTVKQQMAKPVVIPLEVEGHRGAVAYDLLAGKEIPLRETVNKRRALDVDMRRIQGAMIAMLPERIGKLSVSRSTSEDGNSLRLKANLVGESGKTLDAVFPARITVTEGEATRTFYRVLGRELSFELDLPRRAKPQAAQIEVREAISGRQKTFTVENRALEGPSLELIGDEPAVPRPQEVERFLKHVKQVVVVPGRGLPSGTELAKETVERLNKLGIKARIADENSVYRLPLGDPKSEDPLGDGYHSWHSGQEIIAPSTIVEEPVILLGGRGSSFLLDSLAEHGYLSVAPLGGPGLAVRPTIQVATKGLSVRHDTLCLVANDAVNMRRAIERLGGSWKTAKVVAPVYNGEKNEDGDQVARVPSVVSYMGTNEMVQDVQQDRDGNLFAITWGHGKNLYSLTSEGKPRFSRHLPEMGTNHLGVHEDRLFAYTAAGARLYQLTRNGEPLGQARLNMNRGPAQHCDEFSLSHIDYLYLPAKKQIYHNHGDRMRVLDEQYRIVSEWYGEEFRDRDVSDEVLRRRTHGFVLSPDGTKVAQLESSWYFTKAGEKDREVVDTHLVIRDLTGKLLNEYRYLDNGFGVEARLIWSPGAVGPVVYAKNERWEFGGDLTLLSRQAAEAALFVLRDEHVLTRRDRYLVYHDRFQHTVSRLGPFEIIPTIAALSPDGKVIALLDEYGSLTIHRTSDGTRIGRANLPERGQVLRFTNDSQRLIHGGYRGTIGMFNLDGSLVWKKSLGELNDVLGQELSLYDPSFPDHTEKLWPISRDEPGELERLVKMDVNRLSSKWQGPVERQGDYLKVGEKMIGQEITGFLGAQVTWVLEFHYRAANEKAELLAGMMTHSEHPDSLARRLQADATWRYARVVIKNGAKCEKIKIGFQATEGEVLLDKVMLRRVRFPSVNHLLYEPFHAVKPVMLENLLLTSKYNPFGGLKEQAPNRVLLPNTPTGSIPLLEAAYLQNGRLNDVTSRWYNQPPFLGSDVLLSLGLKEPRWVNMVVLYFNAYDADNVTPHIDILVSDLETKTDRLMASVRHNGQVMRIVKFAPVRTSLIKLRFVQSIARLRTLTEVELYGPLSGKEGVPGFDDPEGQNTYMGDFTRVDKRAKTLPEFWKSPVSQPQSNLEDRNFAPPLTQPLVAREQIYIGRTYGQHTMHPLTEPAKELYRTRANGLGFTPFGTLYGGLILRPGIDGKLYCLHPDGGAVLWSVALGERLFGCPVAIQEDIYLVADRKLYQIDLASGGILKEVKLSGGVQGSLTTDGKSLYFISDDGFLQCYDLAELKQRWQVPIAQYSDSTVAVDDGVLYLADQKGTAWAIASANGKTIWKKELSDEFSRCPVVTKDRVVFGCRGGILTVLDRASGKPIWSKKASSRFDYEPLVFGDRLLYFKGKSAMLAEMGTGKESALRYGKQSPGTPFTLPQDPITSISYYRGHLILVDRAGDNQHTTLFINYPWHVNGGTFTVLLPEVETKP